MLSEDAGFKEFHGCNFLNIAGEIPTENLRVYELIQRQKNETRALFTKILKSDSNKEDEIQGAGKLSRWNLFII